MKTASETNRRSDDNCQSHKDTHVQIPSIWVSFQRHNNTRKTRDSDTLATYARIKRHSSCVRGWSRRSSRVAFLYIQDLAGCLGVRLCQT